MTNATQKETMADETIAEAASEEATRAASIHATRDDDLSRRCDRTIKQHALVAAGAGFIPFPLVDLTALTGVQVDMVYRLCALYGVPFSKQAAIGAISSLVGAAIPSFHAGLLASGLKLIPVVGVAAGIVALPALGGAATYAVGKTFVQHLESGGTLLTFSAEKMRAYYEAAVAEGTPATVA